MTTVISTKLKEKLDAYITNFTNGTKNYNNITSIAFGACAIVINLDNGINIRVKYSRVISNW